MCKCVYVCVCLRLCCLLDSSVYGAVERENTSPCALTSSSIGGGVWSEERERRGGGRGSNESISARTIMSRYAAVITKSSQ